MITPSSTNPKVTQDRRHDLPRLLHRSVSRLGVREVRPRERRAEGDQGGDSVRSEQRRTPSACRTNLRRRSSNWAARSSRSKRIRRAIQDFSAQLTAIRSSQPDVIFIPGYYTDVGNIALQARKLGIKVPLLGGDGWDSAKLGEIGGDAINGCFYSNHYSHQDPNPRVQDFIKKYEEQVRRDARRPGRAGLRRGAHSVRGDGPGQVARRRRHRGRAGRRRRTSTA